MGKYVVNIDGRDWKMHPSIDEIRERMKHVELVPVLNPVVGGFIEAERDESSAAFFVASGLGLDPTYDYDSDGDEKDVRH